MDLISIVRQSSVQKKTATKRTKPSGSGFHVVEEEQEKISTSVPQTFAPTASIPVFLNEDPTSQKKRHVMQGTAMLDELHDLRLGLIQGRVSKSTLKHLDVLIQNKKKESIVLDDKLQDILDDIETRVAVELEKLRFMNNKV